MASVLDSLPQRSLTGKHAKGLQNQSALTYNFIDDVDAQVTGMHEWLKEEAVKATEHWSVSVEQVRRDKEEFRAAFQGKGQAAPSRGELIARAPPKTPSQQKVPSFVKCRAALKVKANDAAGKTSSEDIAAAAVAAGRKAAQEKSKSWAMAELKLRKQAEAARQAQAARAAETAGSAAVSSREDAEAIEREAWMKQFPQTFSADDRGESPPRQRMPAAVRSQQEGQERPPLARRKRAHPFDDGSADFQRGSAQPRTRDDSRDDSRERGVATRHDHNDDGKGAEESASSRHINQLAALRNKTQDEDVKNLGWDKIANMVRSGLDDKNSGMFGKSLKLKGKKKIGKGKAKAKGKVKKVQKKKKESSSSSPSSSSSSSESSEAEKKKKKDKKEKKEKKNNAAEPQPIFGTIDLESDVEIESGSDLEIVSSAIAQPEQKGQKKEKKKKDKKEKKEKKEKTPKMADAVSMDLGAGLVAPAPVAPSPENSAAAAKLKAMYPSAPATAAVESPAASPSKTKPTLADEPKAAAAPKASKAPAAVVKPLAERPEI